MRRNERNFIQLCTATAVLLTAFATILQAVAYRRWTDYVSGTLQVDEGDGYGPMGYSGNMYITMYLDSVTPEPGLYIGWLNAVNGSGTLYYRSPGASSAVSCPRDGAVYYAVYFNTYPNTETVDYAGCIVTVIR